MAFPSKAILGGAATASFLWIFGFPGWAAMTFGTLGFLGMGGLQYSKLLYRTFPRDLWMGKNLLSVLNGMKKMKTEGLYITDLFQETAKKYPNKTAIIFEDRRITFRELDEWSNRIANLLRGVGLRHGDTAAMFIENTPEYVAVLLGLSKIGVTGAFINHHLRQEALVHCIKISNCSAVLFSCSLAEALSAVLPELDPTLGDLCYCVDGEAPSIPQSKNLAVEVEKASPNTPPKVEGKSANDKVCYIYTSGTTGLPKACNIKHQRFWGLQSGVGTFSEIQPDDIVYITLPLYHTNGGLLATGQMLFKGATLVIRRKFSASNFWTDCIKHKCTVTFYIGELCRYILAQPKRPTDTQHCIRLCVGNGLRPQIWSAFTKRFNIPQISEFYGSTEGNVGLINPFNKVGACGRISVILPFANPIRLLKVDPDTGEYVRDSNGFCVQAGVNEPGECVGAIREKVNSSHFDGYSDPKATKKKTMTDVFKQGDKYFLSGDILRMDEEGFLYFCDRTGDTFRWKGENVSTTEVESVIGHILELRDVVVYGVEVPGSEGRAGMAAIVGTESTVDLSSLAQQLFLSLPAYAVPLFVRLITEADLTGTYKLKKVQLRNEGFDRRKVSEPLFILNASQKTYEPLTEERYQQVQSGTMRL